MKVIVAAFAVFCLLVVSGCSDEETAPAPPLATQASEKMAPTLSITPETEPIVGKFSPPDGLTLFIAGQDVRSIDAYVENVGPDPAGVTGYSSLERQEGLTLEANYGGGPHHLDYLAQAYPDSGLELGLYLVDFLEPIIDGRADKRIDDFLDHLERYQRPVFLRFGYEFDGPWNLYDPEKYVDAWRYFYDKLQMRGIDHVAMVWQSATHCDGTYGGGPISSWYPGDEYVDWMGLSYFIQEECDFEPIQELLDFAREYEKPVMIAESTPQRYDLRELTFSLDGQNYYARTPGAIWEEWFASYFDLVYSNSDVIQAVTYINARWDDQQMWGSPYYSGYWGDSRVQANEEILQRWKAELSKERWLHADGDLFEVLSN